MPTRSPVTLSPASRRFMIAAVGLVVIGAGTVTARLSGVPKAIPTPPPPSPISIPRELRAPVGALTYRTSAHGRALATISRSGEVRPCLKGSESLQIFDVYGDTILYTDGDLFGVPLACKSRPRTVARLSDLLGRSPIEGDELECARWSPDGKRIALGVRHGRVEEVDDTLLATWAGLGRSVAASGEPEIAWARVDTDPGCIWVGNGHLLRGGIRQWAIDVTTGKGHYLSDPTLWLGSTSPDGRRSVHDLSDARPVDDEESDLVVIVDRVTGLEHQVRLNVGGPWWLPVSVWAPRVSRIVTTDGDRVYVYDEKGALRFSSVILPVTVGSKSANVTWLDDRRIWVGGSRQSGIIDTKDGYWHGVNLPGWEPDPEVGSPDSDHDLQVFTSTNREGSGADAPEFLPVDSRIRTVDELGITFRHPKAWRIARCACSRTVHRAPAFTFEGAPLQEGPHEVSGWMAFSATTETVGHYVRRLSAKYGVGRTDWEEEPVTLRRSRVMLAGMPFESLEFGFWEGAQQLYVGRVGARTIVIEIEPGYGDEPWLRLILDSLTFESR